MPTVTTWITPGGKVTVTVESDPETDGLAYLSLEALAHESTTRALALWREVNLVGDSEG